MCDCVFELVFVAVNIIVIVETGYQNSDTSKRQVIQMRQRTSERLRETPILPSSGSLLHACHVNTYAYRYIYIISLYYEQLP